MVLGALKSRYARRDVPIPVGLADRLGSLIGGGQRRRSLDTYVHLLDGDLGEPLEAASARSTPSRIQEQLSRR